MEMARVSNPDNQKNHSTGPKLLRYLIDHKHWSPFQMCSICFEVYTTRAVSAQICRHRSLNIQEFSQRYSDASKVGKAEIPELRRQDHKNRQNSTDDLIENIGLVDYEKLQQRLKNYYEDAYNLYEDMLAFDVAKESARNILPLSSPTRLYVAGTIRDIMFYLQVRCAHGTQAEHQIVAKQMKKIFSDELPVIAEAMWGDTLCW